VAGVVVNLEIGRGSGGDAEGDTYQGIENVIGTAQRDTITGNGFNNTFYGGDGVDSLNGGAGNDTLYGGNGNDVLDGGAGADILDGGLGTDYVSFTSATAGITVNLITGVHTGDALDDIYASIEAWQLSNFDDVFFGAGAADTVYSRDGNDSLNGGGGNDTLDSGNGNDTLSGDTGADFLRGGAGNDILNGGDDNDVLEGGAGADTFNGGAGTDYATYSGSTAAVTIDLVTSSNNTGDAVGDTFALIEGFVLTSFNDIFVGTGAAEFVYGQAGNDNLSGGGGADILDGGAGVDRIIGGAGNDFLRGGTEADTFVFAAGAGSDTIADFQNGTDKFEIGGIVGVTSFANLTIGASGANATIQFGGNTITVTNAAGLIDSSDFVFV
jgi:Ca2+-binding RTX toxin-like protein